MGLATSNDVAKALGLADSSDLSTEQSNRVQGELDRVERAFIRAAGRDFKAGKVRVQCSVLGGWVTLFDPPAENSDEPVVEDRDGRSVDVDVSDGARLKVSRNNRPLPSGVIVNVEYTAPSVPDSVKAAVAGIVARRLTVTPGSPESKFTEMTAGSDYRVKGAAWVSATAVLTDDERREAESYRPQSGVAIVSRWDDDRHLWTEGWGYNYGWSWPLLNRGYW